MFTRLSRFALAAALPLVVACSAGGGTATSSSSAKPAAPAVAGSGSAQSFTLKGTDTMRFEPATITVKAGQPVQVTLDNMGATIHDFTIEQGVAQKAQAIAQGGRQASATFTIAQAGTYTFICSQPGHEAAGMKGTITVQ